MTHHVDAMLKTHPQGAGAIDQAKLAAAGIALGLTAATRPLCAVALLVGVVAPMVGIFIVQRGLSMIGDALGHVALAGVGDGALLALELAKICEEAGVPKGLVSVLPGRGSVIGRRS